MQPQFYIIIPYGNQWLNLIYNDKITSLGYHPPPTFKIPIFYFYLKFILMYFEKMAIEDHTVDEHEDQEIDPDLDHLYYSSGIDDCLIEEAEYRSSFL